jgi:iron(III) transport system substrate-binding protein
MNIQLWTWLRRSSLTIAVAVGGLVLALAACGGSGSSGGGGHTITLYNGQHPQLTTALVDAFEKQSGINVQVRTDDGIVLADQILQEGPKSPADVYLTENSPELVALTEHHLLAQLPTSITNQIPSQYNSPTGNWVGIALRVAALVYNPSLISSPQLPTKLLDLAQPRWKGKVAVAPTDSDFVPLVGAVIASYGTATAQSWLTGLKANASSYQDIEGVVAAVNRGTEAVGIINQYYWYRLRLETGVGGVHSKLYFFPNHDVGALENIAGAAVLASSTHQADADKFVSFLVSAQAQNILSAGDDFEYPIRAGSDPNPQLPPLTSLNPAVIDVIKLGDDQPAAALIQKVGLT